MKKDTNVWRKKCSQSHSRNRQNMSNKLKIFLSFVLLGAYVGLLTAFVTWKTHKSDKILKETLCKELVGDIRGEVQIRTCKGENQTFVEQNQLHNFEETKNLSKVTIVRVVNPSCESFEFMSKCEDEWTIEEVKNFFSF